MDHAADAKGLREMWRWSRAHVSCEASNFAVVPRVLDVGSRASGAEARSEAGDGQLTSPRAPPSSPCSLTSVVVWTWWCSWGGVGYR
jgi:hypothetical protein